mmetsp:Transcript_37621/g.69471  ORF Transcript_37621/g.69471 Transcript_37621/m.69471 type:complete len:693 (-) Transcript_37621:16-2094(-)
MKCREICGALLAMMLILVLAEPEESCTSGAAPRSRSMIQLNNRRQQPARQMTIDQLSPELRVVGASLMGSEENLVALLRTSQIVDINYAGIPMQIMMAANDDAITRYGPGLENGEEYGLETLLKNEPTSMGLKMLNMIDFGANLGVVSIAVYKKYPGVVRAVVVEPAPTTYFYLVTNLWLNQVPPLTGGPGTMQPGIAGLQKAVSPDKNLQLTMCIPGHDVMSGSMNAHPINSMLECDCGGKDACSTVGSIGVEDLFGYFGNEDIQFVKMDCEACEMAALPSMDQYSYRIRRFAGEMHMMPPNIVDIACKFNEGEFLTGMCSAAGTERVVGKNLCEKCSSGMLDPTPQKAPATKASVDAEETEVTEDEEGETAPTKPTKTKTTKVTEDDDAPSPKTSDGSVITFKHLPKELQDVGIKLFGSKQNLITMLSKTQVLPVSFAEIDMKLAMAENDDAASRYGPGADNGEEYGLDTITKKKTGMVNLIDLGANLGTVTIAIYKKYPKRVRAVSVEPVPTTYFYFVLNLWLNDIPQLRTGDDFTKAGVVAVQKAVHRKADFKMEMCIPGHDDMSGSMNAYFVTDDKPCRCEDGGPDLCSTVKSVNLDSIFEIYGSESINFLKMDCEGCEEDALPALEEGGYKERVLRLAGEMHMMPPKIYDLVCQYNKGEYLTGMCQNLWPDRAYGLDLCDGCSSSK